jgi:hypothetical protein
MHRHTVALAIALTLRLSSSVSAQPLESATRTQPDFSRIRLKVGDHIYVSDPERKVEISGRLTSLSADELSVDGYQFAPKPGLKIERSGDTIWDGATLGFLVGALGGVTWGAEACLRTSIMHCFFNDGIFYGAVGAYIDWKHKGRTTVFLGAPDAHGRAVDATTIDTPSSLSIPAIDFSALTLKVGDEVAVTAPDGTQTTGRVTSLAATTFREGNVDLSSTAPVRIERIGDPIWDGVAMGVGVATLEAVAVQCSLRCGATIAAIYGTIGGIVDWRIKGRTVIYGAPDAPGRSSSLRVIPEIDAHRKALALAVRF